MNDQVSRTPMLSVEQLGVSYRVDGKLVSTVRNVSFDVRPGEIFGLVGESGSGKSTVLNALLGLLPSTAEIKATSVQFDGRDLHRLAESDLAKLRGRDIALIPQRPMSSLSPVATMHKQLDWFFRDGDEKNSYEKALDRVGLRAVKERLGAYPFQFSGGQLQRMLIAIATMSNSPRLLLADEPTTTLDVTVQAQVLRLLQDLRDRLGVSILFVTHDFGVVAQLCDRVGVMHRGELVETADVATLFSSPSHERTRALLEALPHRRLTTTPVAVTRDELRPATPRLELDNVTKRFELRTGIFGRAAGDVHAVTEVSLDVVGGQTLALVGESGCGKSTVGRMILGLEAPTDGQIRLDGEALPSGDRPRRLRREIQLISQNPWSALNRRKTIGHALTQPLEIHRLVHGHAAQLDRAAELLRQVGLPADYLNRFPSAVSGGELQRVTVARALAVEPSVLVLDEPTASLDVTVKAVLVDLLLRLQQELDLTYLFITHEIEIAQRVSQAAAVMYLGRVVESGPAAQVFDDPLHPYTQSLLASVPQPDPSQRKVFRVIQGEVPSPLSPPPGCAFAPRCSIAVAGLCEVEVPMLLSLDDPDHLASCHVRTGRLRRS